MSSVQTTAQSQNVRIKPHPQPASPCKGSGARKSQAFGSGFHSRYKNDAPSRQLPSPACFATPVITKLRVYWTGKMSQSIKCVAYKHEGIIFFSRTHVKRTDMVVHTCVARAGEVDTGGSLVLINELT